MSQAWILVTTRSISILWSAARVDRMTIGLSFENVKIYKVMYGNPDAVWQGVRMPYISL